MDDNGFGPAVFPGAAPSPLRWLVLLMAGAGAMCAMMSTISFAPIIGTVAHDLKLDLGSASFAFIGLASFAMAAGMSAMGFLVDRLGAFPVIIGSLVAFIASSIGILISGQDYAALLALRLVQGVCSAGLMVAITPTIALWFPTRELGRAMSVPSIGAGIGMIIGLNAVPRLTVAWGSWHEAVAALGIVAAGALAVAVIAATLARREPGSARAASTSERFPIRDIFRLRLFRIGLLAIALACWANMSFGDLTPGYLSVMPPVGVGHGPQTAGLLMSLFAVTNVLGAPLAGVLMDRAFPHRNTVVVIIGFAISAVVYTAVLIPGVHDSRAILGMLLIVGGLANPFVNVTLMSIAAKSVSHQLVGRICGLWMSASFFAGAAGVMAGSLTLHATGDYRLSLLIVGAVSVAGVLLSLSLPASPAGPRGAAGELPNTGSGRAHPSHPTIRKAA